MEQKQIPREDKVDVDVFDLPEPHRRADNNPLVLSVEKADDDDIYFIGRILETFLYNNIIIINKSLL